MSNLQPSDLGVLIASVRASSTACAGALTLRSNGRSVRFWVQWLTL